MLDEVTRAAYPFLAPLEAAAPALLAEVQALPEPLWRPAPGYSDGVHVCQLEAGPFKRGVDPDALARARAACPVAVRVFGGIEGLLMGGYQRFVHGAAMAVHTDPRADDMIRCILGLQLPERERAWWPPGRARLLDTRLPHWARNDDAAPRYTLVIDVRMPFTVDSTAWPPWRPDEPGELAKPGDGVPESAFAEARRQARAAT